MKKIIAIVLAIVFVCALTACGGSSNNNNNNNNSSSSSAPASATTAEPTASPTKDVVFGEMKITLPDDFTEKNDLIPEGSSTKYYYINGDGSVAFGALNEEKSGFEGTAVKSLDDYLQVQHDNSKGDVTSDIKEDNGLKYFDYEANGSSDTLTFKYFSTAYESEDNYWFVQIYTTDDLYPRYEQEFISWAHTVTEA